MILNQFKMGNFVSTPIEFTTDVAVQLGLLLLIFLVLTIFLYKKFKRKIVFLVSFIYLAVSFVAAILNFEILKLAILSSTAFVCVIFTFISNHELKSSLRSHITQTQKTPKSGVIDVNEKEQLINTLVQAVDYLSARKIGAIITIEKIDVLNAFIDKAVKLDALVTVELLKTIFFPNTALHDGAVIIRGNRIACAGAFYTPSDKPDIQSELGSRHRAAIGISEDSDAFTLVVSEETGRVSTTIGGTITQGISEEALRLSLENHILIQ